MQVNLAEISDWIFGMLATIVVSIIGFLGKRSFDRIDDDMKDLDGRISRIERLDIMMRPDVLALYADQKEELRQRVRELREDQKALREELSRKLDYVISRIDHSQHNEREGDK